MVYICIFFTSDINCPKKCCTLNVEHNKRSFKLNLHLFKLFVFECVRMDILCVCDICSVFFISVKKNKNEDKKCIVLSNEDRNCAKCV